MAKTRRCILGLVAGALVSAVQATAPEGADWPQFRGLERNGISREVGLLRRWPKSGPREMWRRPIGEGFSGMAVVGGRLYTMFAAQAEDAEKEAMEFAGAFDTATGKELWRTPVGKEFAENYGNGPRSTPTVEGETVFVLGSLGDLAALDTQDGHRRWKLNLPEAFGSKVPNFGFSMSPLVDGDQLIVQGGGPWGKSYAALDKKTGAVKWTFGDSPPVYGSPLIMNTPAGPCYAYFGKKVLNCVDRNGEKVWSQDWPDVWTNAMPIFVPPDMLFASGAESAGGVLYRVQMQEGRLQIEEVWKQSLMRNKFNSSVVHDNHIYGFDEATLRCISLEDGTASWAKRLLGWGSLILADGRLFVLTDKGRLLLLEASPKSYRQKGAVQALTGRSWTAPTLAHGRLYLRNHTEMVSYDVRK